MSFPRAPREGHVQTGPRSPHPAALPGRSTRARSGTQESKRSPEEAEAPASCRLSVTLAWLPIGQSLGPAPLRPRLPRGWTGRGGGAAATPPLGHGRARPAVSYGGGPARRALAGPVLAASRSLPPAARGEVGAARAASATASPPPSSPRPPFPAPSSRESPA